MFQFSDLTPRKVKQILDRYGKADGIEKKDSGKFFKLFKDKNYCLLVFLKNPRIIKSFNIDKSGFGMMSAWITVRDINEIKK